MALGGILWLLQTVGAIALDRFIARVTGESRQLDTLEANIGRVGERQSEILELIRQQLAAHFRAGLLALEQAQNCDESEPGYQASLRDAVREFNYCASLKYFTGLLLAQVYVDKAVCHHLLGERRNAIGALKKARRVAAEAAKQNGEIYVREETSQPIEVRLSSGKVLQGVRWTRRDVPQVNDGALALRDQIDEALRHV